MIASRVKFAFCMAALVLLWGCETPTQSTDRPASKNDSPFGDFFRTAAETSQDKFDYQSAAKYYQNLHKRDPNDMAALLGLARNLRYIGSAASSLALLEEALPGNPGNFAIRAEYGKSLVAAGRGRRAIDYLTELLEEIPDDWELLSALGIAHDLLGESGKAERAYRSALEITPENPSIINNLALSLALSDQIDEGIALLEKTTNTVLSTPHLRQNLALMYAMKGDIKSARRLAEWDLPREMVDSNIEYYERFFPRMGGAQSSRSQSSGTVEVSRLEEPAETVVEPVIPTPAPQTVQEPEATTTMAAVEETVGTDQAIQTAYQTRRSATWCLPVPWPASSWPPIYAPSCIAARKFAAWSCRRYKLFNQERFERDVRVGEGRRFGPRPLFHEHAGEAQVTRAVDGVRTDDEAVAQVEGGELMGRHIAANDDLVPALGQTDHL